MLRVKLVDALFGTAMLMVVLWGLHYLHPLAYHYGVYRGFTPTSYSPAGTGEFKVEIGFFSWKLTTATGERLLVTEGYHFGYRRLSVHQMLRRSPLLRFQQVVPLSHIHWYEDLLGYSVPVVFVKVPGGWEVSFHHTAASLLGPTIAWGPGTFGDNHFKRVLSRMEAAAYKGVVPLIRRKGKALPEPKPSLAL